MAYKVIYGYRAEESLSNIERYLEERSASGAKNVLADIKNSIDTLAEYPFIGVTTQRFNFRFQVAKKYRYKIIYRIHDKALHIFQILPPETTTERNVTIQFPSQTGP